jgi:hypothetical protein
MNQTQTQTQTQIHKNQNQTQTQNAAAIQDIYEKIYQTSEPASTPHEIRDPHGILDIVASRSRL